MTMLRLLPDLDRPEERPGRGLLFSAAGNLPLVAMSVAAEITGLIAGLSVSQRFRNPHDCPIEATYIFPLPDRAAVTSFHVTIGDRHITGVLEERQAARDTYDAALKAGQRAAILEEERPDVFTTRIGNLAPGEEATIALTLAGPVVCELGEVTFRVPLVVAPRYIPGRPLDGRGVGDGTALDTDLVPDASRITPPVLLSGSPNPVELSLSVRLDPAGLAVADLSSSLHATTVAGGLPDTVTLDVRSGERLDRDFILRYRVDAGAAGAVSAVATPDGDGAADEGTVVVTVVPPAPAADAPARQVVLLVDRSGSMNGWKMVAARRAAARIIDSLTSADRFAVLAFDEQLERPPGQPRTGLRPASDRNRYQAVEWLGQLGARGGTELGAALAEAETLREGPGTTAPGARATILVTDGQVGDEDRLLRSATAAGVRMYCVGIDRAVNAGLLRRLAAATGGRCDLVESEDRLDEVLADLHRRLAHPVAEAVSVTFDGLSVSDDTVTPAGQVDLYAGAPLVVSARYRGRPGAQVTVTSKDGTALTAPVTVAAGPAVGAVWARSHLRDLEDRYASRPPSFSGEQGDLAARIVAVSRRHGVLCRFTAWVAVDDAGDPVTGVLHRIVQPVELPSGWAAAGAPAGPAVWAAAPMGAAQPAPMPFAPVAVPPLPPYTPPPPPGTRPPLQASGKPLAAARRAAPTAVEATPLTPSLGAYRSRIEELLAAVEQLADPSDTVATATLAAEARLLADDVASALDDRSVVSLVELLAVALAGGRPAAMWEATQALRDRLAADPAGRRRRSFWR